RPAWRTDRMHVVNWRRGTGTAAVLLALNPAASAPTRAGDDDPRAHGHDGRCHWSGPCSGLVLPYRTRSWLYGYPDYAYGRGPVNDLGRATLYPGFRGYGVIGSPGYGLGVGPASLIDSVGQPAPLLRPDAWYRVGVGPRVRRRPLTAERVASRWRIAPLNGSDPTRAGPADRGSDDG